MKSPCYKCNLFLKTNKNDWPRCKKHCVKRDAYLSGLVLPALNTAESNQPQTRKCISPDCINAGKDLPLSKFSRHARTKDGYALLCKDCQKIKITAGQQKKKELGTIKGSPKPKRGRPRKTLLTPRNFASVLQKRVNEISPPKSKPAGPILSIDFTNFPEVYSDLETLSIEEDRTIEAQARHIIRRVYAAGLSAAE